MINFQTVLPWIWLGITVVLVVIEILTSGLTTIWFAASSFLMIFCALLKLPLWLQLILFTVISLLLLIFTRPILRKKIAVKKTPMNADALIGKKAVVVKPISELEKGTIKINGLEWTAATNDNSPLQVGDICIITKIQGATAIVTNQENK